MPTRVPTFRSPTLPAARPLYERLAGRKVDKAFYKSPAWRKLRLVRLMMTPLCEDCRKLGITTAATEVHHAIDRKARPELALDLDNLMSLCKSCHSKRKGE